MGRLRSLIPQDRSAFTPECVDRVDLFVEARCPCGSERPHLLNATTRSACRRCGRVVALKELHFSATPGRDVVLRMDVSIGPL